MKKYLLYFALTALTIGCSQDSSEVDQKTTDSKVGILNVARYSCDPQIVDINAGQNYLSGNVTVGNNADFIYVVYNANVDWRFTELHLYLGPLSGVPQKNGNPTPGKFPYKVNFNSLTSSYTFEIPIGNVQKDANGCFVVAAHSSMKKINSNGSVVQTETGWAGYNNFSGNNWARYFSSCICAPQVND